MPDKQWTVLLISLLLGLPLFAYTVSGLDLSTVRSTLVNAPMLSLAAYLLLSVFNVVVYTMIWSVFLSWQSVSIPLVTLFNYRMTGFAISYVTPGPRVGGEITRAGLVQRHASFEKGLFTASFDTFMLFLGGLVFDTAAIILAVSTYPTSGSLHALLAGLALAVLLVLGAWWFGVTHGGIVHVFGWLAENTTFTEVRDRAAAVIDEVELYIRRRTTSFIGLVGASVATKVGIAVQLYVLVGALGIPISFLEAVFLAAAIDLAYSIPAYMGVGFLEAGQSAVFSLAKRSTETGVLVALITRLRDILLSVYGLLALLYYTIPGRR